MNSIKIGIIEDNPLLCLSYKIYLSEFPNYELIFSFGSFEELEHYFESETNMPPDLVFLDLQLTGQEGSLAIPLLLKNNPDVKIVVISSFTDIEKVLLVFKLGAHGYVSKAMPLSELSRTIEDVYLYGTNISPDLAAKLLEHASGKLDTKVYKVLSGRELDIALAVMDGKTYKEMGEQLNVSVHTINFHLKNIYRKLDVNSKSSLVALLISEKFTHTIVAKQPMDIPRKNFYRKNIS